MGTPAPTAVSIKNLSNKTARVLAPQAIIGYGSAVNTIASSSADQMLAPEKLGRQGWMIKAVKANAGSLWVAIGRGPQVGRDIEVTPGEPFVCPPNLVSGDELRIRGTVGDKFAFIEA